MTRHYLAMPLHRLDTELDYFRPTQELPERVTMDSPAVLVMTDLRQVTAHTVEPNVTIDGALDGMKDKGVRLLLVTGPGGRVTGLITSTDIQGEKPMKLVKEVGGQRAELLVRDIMTPADQLEAVTMAEVLKAHVGDVVATLKRAGRRHALVTDQGEHHAQPAIRGIFSISQIGKQLGVAIETVEVATTFSEVEAALNS